MMVRLCNQPSNIDYLQSGVHEFEIQSNPQIVSYFALKVKNKYTDL